VTWAPSGRELFFLDRADAKSAERVMRFDLASGGRSPATHPPDGSLDEREPTVSPDGRLLAFLRDRSDRAQDRIILDLETGAERVLYTRNDTDGAAWSDDSQTLFVDTHDGGDYGLWAWPLDGSAPDRILSAPEPMHRLAAGPHGMLAAETMADTSTLAQAPGRPEDSLRVLAPERATDAWPEIAPDGTIAFISNRPGGAGVWVLPRGGQPRKLLPLVRKDSWGSEPRWSPDGTRLAFATPVANATGLRVVTAAGADVAVIPVDALSVRAPAWSDDGSALIFPARDAQGWRLWRVLLTRPDEPQPLPQSGWVYIRSSGDALFGIREDQPGVWRIDASPRRITPQPGPDEPEMWAVAGNEIAYVENAFGSDARVVVQPVDGGPPRALVRLPHYAPGDGIALDPGTGSVVYPATLKSESDIELIHLVRR
jgi:Tol biopolymer transport system component